MLKRIPKEKIIKTKKDMMIIDIILEKGRTIPIYFGKEFLTTSQFVTIINDLECCEIVNDMVNDYFISIPDDNERVKNQFRQFLSSKDKLQIMNRFADDKLKHLAVIDK